MTKEKAILEARRTANRDNAPMAVLNLNPFNPLYVIRAWNDRMEGHKDLVFKAYPSTIDGD